MRATITDALLDRSGPPASRPQAFLWDLDMPNFGVVLGRRVQTFVVTYRTEGRKLREAIGQRGAVLADGSILTLDRAREIAGARLALRNKDSEVTRAERVMRAAIKRWIAAVVRAELRRRS
jgi:hypothetical protein